MKKETHNSFSYDLTTFFGRRHHLQNTTFFALSLRVNGPLNNLISILFIFETFRTQDKLITGHVRLMGHGDSWGLIFFH